MLVHWAGPHYVSILFDLLINMLLADIHHNNHQVFLLPYGEGRMQTLEETLPTWLALNLDFFVDIVP